jgi:hypothetical protein
VVGNTLYPWRGGDFGHWRVTGHFGLLCREKDSIMNSHFQFWNIWQDADISDISLKSGRFGRLWRKKDITEDVERFEEKRCRLETCVLGTRI